MRRVNKLNECQAIARVADSNLKCIHSYLNSKDHDRLARRLIQVSGSIHCLINELEELKALKSNRRNGVSK